MIIGSSSTVDGMLFFPSSIKVDVFAYISYNLASCIIKTDPR